MTSLPMVFALWSGPSRDFMEGKFRTDFADSCRYGIEHIDDIVRLDSPQRGFPEDLVRTYLTRHIQFELTADHLRGLDLFWRSVRELRN